ncbi:MAG: hypothetical protein RL412_424 [Pseudomonadota bacterium]|jgi:hypothetical protein
MAGIFSLVTVFERRGRTIMAHFGRGRAREWCAQEFGPILAAHDGTSRNDRSGSGRYSMYRDPA